MAHHSPMDAGTRDANGPATRSFPATLEPRPDGGVAIAIPFDPVEAWGDKDRHYVAGAIEAGAYAGR